MTAIIVAGRIYKELIPYLIETYSGLNKNHIYLSTWIDQCQESIQTLKNENFNIIIQEPPLYKTSANYQSKSLQLPLKILKEKGYEKVFRIRTDTRVNNIKKLIGILEENCFEDKIYTLSFHRNLPTSEVYITDHFFFGPIDLQIKLWSSEQLPGDERFPEKFLQESYIGKPNLELEELKIYFSDFYDLCVENEIKLYYTKTEYIHYEELTKLFIEGRANAYRNYKL